MPYCPRCNEFVLSCEVHRHTLNDPDHHCCDVLFDTEPIFTNKGTCYRTNKTIYEYYPYSFSAIKIWTNLLQDQTPGIKIIIPSFLYPNYYVLPLVHTIKYSNNIPNSFRIRYYLSWIRCYGCSWNHLHHK